MDALLTIILNEESDKAYQEVKQQLLSIKDDLSISPYIEYNGMKNHIIFNITMKIAENKISEFLDKLSNNFEGEYDDCESFSTFAKMFNDYVYYIGFMINE